MLNTSEWDNINRILGLQGTGLFDYLPATAPTVKHAGSIIQW